MASRVQGMQVPDRSQDFLLLSERGAVPNSGWGPQESLCPSPSPLKEDTSLKAKGSVTTGPVTAERTWSKGLILGMIEDPYCTETCSDVKESACRGPGSSPRLGRSPGERNGNPFPYSCLENSMDRGAWRATVHGVAKSWTRLSS